MKTVVLTGIDPGLVHTGVVHLQFSGPGLIVDSQVFAGTDPRGAANYAQSFGRYEDHIWIEAYTDRASAYGGDQRMRDLLAQFKLLLPKATVLDNMGVKTVVTQELMELLGCWRFPTPTHHQDLRSAARIALFGALKDPALNQMIYDYLEKEMA